MKLFLEQGTFEDKKQKELQEYLDAKNKEVIEAALISGRSVVGRALPPWGTPRSK